MDTPLFDPGFLVRLERLSLATRRAFAGQMKGTKRSTRRGSSVEFADYREYMLGDDLRYVDWNTAARLEKLFIKMFMEEEDLFLALLIDTSASMGFGAPTKLRYAAQVAGAIGYIALTNYDRTAVTAFGVALKNPLPATRGRAGVQPFLRYLEALQADGATSLHGALKTFAGRSKSRGLAVVVSDLMDASWQEGIRALAGRGFQVVVLHVLAPEEIDPPYVGDLRIIDSETGEDREMSISPALLGRYRAALEEFRADAERLARKHGADYVPIVTTDPIESLVLQDLRGRGIVR